MLHFLVILQLITAAFARSSEVFTPVPSKPYRLSSNPSTASGVILFEIEKPGNDRYKAKLGEVQNEIKLKTSKLVTALNAARLAGEVSKLAECELEKSLTKERKLKQSMKKIVGVPVDLESEENSRDTKIYVPDNCGGVTKC